MISFLLLSDHHYLRHEDTRREIRVEPVVCESQCDQSVLFVVYSVVQFTCVACTVCTVTTVRVYSAGYTGCCIRTSSEEISPRLLALSPGVAVLQ